MALLEPIDGAREVKLASFWIRHGPEGTEGARDVSVLMGQEGSGSTTSRSEISALGRLLAQYVVAR